MARKSYKIDMKKLFKKTVNCRFMNERDPNTGKTTNNTPFDEFKFFIEEEAKAAALSIEAIAKAKGRKSIKVEDVIEYFGFVGRPELYKRD